MMPNRAACHFAKSAHSGLATTRAVESSMQRGADGARKNNLVNRQQLVGEV